MHFKTGLNSFISPDLPYKLNVFFVLALPLFETRCAALVRTNTGFVIKALNCSSLLPTLCQAEVSNTTGTSDTGMCSLYTKHSIYIK